MDLVSLSPYFRFVNADSRILIGLYLVEEVEVAAGIGAVYAESS